MANDVIVVLVTCPPDRAQGLASILVENRVAACVNVVTGLHSTYRWQGAVERSAESLLIVKTTREQFETLKDTVLRHHPYELPEVIALPVELGHAPYLQWVAESTR